MRRCSSKERQEMPDLNLLYLFMYLGLQTEENSILLSFVFETRLRSPECGIRTYTYIYVPGYGTLPAVDRNISYSALPCT